jgi:hypothetical protein
LSMKVGPNTLTNIVKSFAFALVGGYGGTMILEKALGSVVAEMKDTVKKQQSQIEKQIAQREADRKALSMVDRHLSDTKQAVARLLDLTQAIQDASPVAQHHIRSRTSDKRRQAWQRKWSETQESTGDLTERTIPIFQALVEDPNGEDNERRLSQLAYALKDQRVPDWDRAFKYINRAIEMVDTPREVPHHYNYTWALAAIHRHSVADSEPTESIEEITNRLRASLEFPPLAQGFQKELEGKVGDVVRPWLADNNIELSDLGINVSA